MNSLLPPSHSDRVVPGRYVYADGALHRDPTGEGRLACNTVSAAFRPAPGGGAVGVWARGKLYLLRASRLGPVTRGVRWIDLRGVVQPLPSEQTRGILLPSGRRLWLDVWPAVAATRVAGTTPRGGPAGSTSSGETTRVRGASLASTGLPSSVPVLGIALLVFAAAARTTLRRRCADNN